MYICNSCTIWEFIDPKFNLLQYNLIWFHAMRQSTCHAQHVVQDVFQNVLVFSSVPAWSWHWSAAGTGTGRCCGTAGQSRTSRRDSRDRWGCGWCWSAPDSGWSWVSQSPPGGFPETRWRSPAPPWFLAWLHGERCQMRAGKDKVHWAVRRG